MDATKQYDSIGIVTGFNIAQREIKRRTRWVNFEPNNTETRARVVRDITGLLRGWRTQREPVLQGATDAAAFFIICDATNNTPAIIAQHKLVCRVGLLFQGSTRFSEYTLEQDTRAIDAELAATA
jgi:phage tail sheath protein FI